MPKKRDRGERIVDTALDLAETRSWEAVRLHDIARAAGASLEDIHQHFPDKEAIGEAWFDRADAAMLEAAEAPDWASLPERVRLHRAIMAWLDTLAPHRRVTRQIIRGKLEPGHLQVQLPALVRISRTVQWLREVAGYKSTLPRRAVEETVTTGIFVTVFIFWMRDRSPGSRRTRRLLDTLLGTQEAVPPGAPQYPPPPTAGAVEEQPHEPSGAPPP